MPYRVLFGFTLAESPECPYCGDPFDDVEHAVRHCPCVEELKQASLPQVHYPTMADFITRGGEWDVSLLTYLRKVLKGPAFLVYGIATAKLKLKNRGKTVMPHDQKSLKAFEESAE